MKLDIQLATPVATERKYIDHAAYCIVQRHDVYQQSYWRRGSNPVTRMLAEPVQRFPIGVKQDAWI